MMEEIERERQKIFTEWSKRKRLEILPTFLLIHRKTEVTGETLVSRKD